MGMSRIAVAFRSAAAASVRSAGGRRWCSTARAAALCRDHYAYFKSVEGLLYLHSSVGLKLRAELCVDLARELLELIPDAADDVPLALEIIDTLNNVLCLVLDPAEATRNTHPDPKYRQAAHTAFQKVFEFMSVLNGSRALYDVLVAAMRPEVADRLPPVMRRNALLMKRDMDSFGIHRPPGERAQIAEWANQKEELAAELTQTQDAAHRMRVLEALLLTRHRLARFLHHPSYAHWSMEPTMVGSPEAAWRFLSALSQRWRRELAHDDMTVLRTVKKNVKYPSHDVLPEGADMIFDYEFHELSGIYRRMVHPHADAITAYLSVANVWRGIELLCRSLFGVELVRAEATEYEAYHPLVQKFILYEAEGAAAAAEGLGGRRKLGTIYADLIEREGKLPTPCHFTVQLGTRPHARVLEEVDVDGPEGGRQLPVVIFSCNARGRVRSESPPSGDATGDQRGLAVDAGESSTPSLCGWDEVLLTHDETKSLLHEFGHALHTMLAQTDLQNVAGTRSSLDYVEFPSQFFEYFASDYRVLKHFARHYQTGDVLPEELLEASNKRLRCFRAIDRLEHVVLSLTDLVMHGPRPLSIYDTARGEFVPVPSSDGAGGGGEEVKDGERPRDGPKNFFNSGGDAAHDAYLPAVRALYRLHTPITLTRFGEQRTFSLSHLSNYPAGYYSYEYSRVVAAWLWCRYFDADPLTREGGARLRRAMELGASMAPRAMLREAFGDDIPDPCEMVRQVDLKWL